MIRPNIEWAMRYIEIKPRHNPNSDCGAVLLNRVGRRSMAAIFERIAMLEELRQFLLHDAHKCRKEQIALGF